MGAALPIYFGTISGITRTFGARATRPSAIPSTQMQVNLATSIWGAHKKFSTERSIKRAQDDAGAIRGGVILSQSSNGVF